jgi:hypothetical protein
MGVHTLSTATGQLAGPRFAVRWAREIREGAASTNVGQVRGHGSLLRLAPVLLSRSECLLAASILPNVVPNGDANRPDRRR